MLDHIDALDLEAQKALLGCFREGDRTNGVNNCRTLRSPRLLALAEENLKQRVDSGKFRKDLYVYVNLSCIELPPLRSRREDISILATHFAVKYRPLTSSRAYIKRAALSRLSEYEWPGNIDELEDTMRIMATQGQIWDSARVSDLPLKFQNTESSSYLSDLEVILSDSKKSVAMESIPTLAAAEKQLILWAIAKCDGDRVAAAKALGIGKTTLYRKLKEYGTDTEITSTTHSR